MDDVIDSLQIEIESNATNAGDQIDKLVRSIRKLDKLGQNAGLVTLRSNLKKLTSLDFSSLQSQLTSIADSLKTISSFRSFMKNLNGNMPHIEVAPTTVASPESVLDMEDMNIDVDTSVVHSELEGVREEVVQVGESFNAATTNGTTGFGELSTKLQAVERLAVLTTQKAQMLGEVWQQTLEQFGEGDVRTISAEIAFRNAEKGARSLEEEVVRLKRQLEELNKSKFTKGLEGFGNSLKRIFLYRAIRTLLAHTFNAIKEGIQNIAACSEEAQQTLSKLSSSTGELKNALGAALMPVLKAITPILIQICEWATELLNDVAAFTTAITGGKSYEKAIKYNKDYADSLKKIKQSQLGIDELNIIGENNDDTSDTVQMFENVSISSGEAAESITKMSMALASIAGLLIVFKGKEIWAAITGAFGKLWTNIKGIGTSLKGFTVPQKAVTSIALLAAEAFVAYDAFSGAVEGTKSWGTALLEFIPITLIVGAAMTAMLGPVGAILTAIVAVIAAVAGVIKAKNELKRKAAMEKFWKAEGVAISEVTKMLDKYARNLGIMEQKEWNETLETTSDTLIDMARDYDALWDSLSKTKNLDSSKIDKLVKSFNALADAAMEVNKAAIGSLMNNIRMGIEMNITPELTARLEGLIGSLEAAQDLLNVKVQGIKAEYQALLNEIASNGGEITEDQRAKLNEMRSQIDTFTLTDNTSSEVWAVNLQQAIEKGISAGTDQESIKSNINDLTSQRDDYLETLKQAYGSSVSTLKQLIELDKNEFGGALGFKDSDLDTLEENYKAQIAQVNSQFNSVLDAIINSFSNNAIKHNELPGYKPEDSAANWFSNFGYGFLKGISFGTYKSGEEKAYNEQQEFLEWLKGLKGYASGGYPEDDSLIYVNPYELVGKMSNGKNVVANNEMITEGIRRATYEAMVEANRENGNNGGGNAENLEIKVYLDGRQISATVEKNKRTKGVGETIYKGGVLNGI